MRYLIDTNIFVYLALDIEMLSRDVKAILEEPDTLLYISAESVRELIVGYRNKGLCSKRWKTVEAMRVKQLTGLLLFVNAHCHITDSDNLAGFPIKKIF